MESLLRLAQVITDEGLLSQVELLDLALKQLTTKQLDQLTANLFKQLSTKQMHHLVLTAVDHSNYQLLELILAQSVDFNKITDENGTSAVIAEPLYKADVQMLNFLLEHRVAPTEILSLICRPTELNYQQTYCLSEKTLQVGANPNHQMMRLNKLSYTDFSIQQIIQYLELLTDYGCNLSNFKLSSLISRPKHSSQLTEYLLNKGVQPSYRNHQCLWQLMNQAVSLNSSVDLPQLWEKIDLLFQYGAQPDLEWLENWRSQYGALSDSETSVCPKMVQQLDQLLRSYIVDHSHLLIKSAK